MTVAFRRAMPSTGALAASALLLGVVASLLGPLPAQASTGSIGLPEVPNSVAVTDTGVKLVSMKDRKTVALVDSTGQFEVQMMCSPSAVAVAPAGDRGWAVCQDDPHLRGINLVTGETVVADVGTEGALSLAYIPGSKKVVVGDNAGHVTVVSVTSDNDYQVLQRIPLGGPVSMIAMAPDGRTGYSWTAPGTVMRFDIESGSAKALAKFALPRANLFSLAVSPSGRTLYAGACDLCIGAPTSAGAAMSTGAAAESPIPAVLFALDARSGRTLQRTVLRPDGQDFSQIFVAASHRALYVGTGVGVPVGMNPTGVFQVALDGYGRMGAMSTLLDAPAFVGAIALSVDGRSFVAGTTGPELYSVDVPNAPYRPAMAITAKVTGTSVALSGKSHGISAGAKVSVFIKDLTKKKPAWVEQKKKATVGADGRFAWKGAMPSSHVEVYVKAGTTKSATVAVGAHGPA